MRARHAVTWLLSVGVLAAILFITIGCGASMARLSGPQATSGSQLPSWLLDFSRFRGDASYHVSPRQALADAAMAEYTPDGSLHPLAAVSWLVAGPRFGLAVVQLDLAGQYREFVTLEPDSAVQSWQVGFELELPPACAQADAAGSADSPLGVTCGIGTAGSLNPPILALTYWATPAGAAYITVRTEAVVTRPASGSVALTVADRPVCGRRHTRAC